MKEEFFFEKLGSVVVTYINVKGRDGGVSLIYAYKSH
jgi:hypothetical protein